VVLPFGVVTSCRKLAGSLRTGQSKPRLAKKGSASFTGPWNISCLHIRRSGLKVITITNLICAWEIRSLKVIQWLLQMARGSKPEAATNPSAATSWGANIFSWQCSPTLECTTAE